MKFKYLAFCMCLLLVGILQIASCRSENQKPSNAPTSAVASALVVRTEADGIHVESSLAEFVLTASGYLKSSMKVNGKKVTLDDPGSESGQQVTLAHKNVDDIVLDLSTARVSDAQGKLGRLGKHVEVSGKSKSVNPDIAATLILEVYDDFPALALLSATYRNDGAKDLPVDSVSLQRHRLNASLADATAAPHEMWSFFGSSLKWGKDDVLPIPAKFEQQNPFGAPVDTKDDLGRVGGGIPVVAFWTRTMGEAIGHIETLPLVMSIPVNTTRTDACLQR